MTEGDFGCCENAAFGQGKCFTTLPFDHFVDSFYVEAYNSLELFVQKLFHLSEADHIL